MDIESAFAKALGRTPSSGERDRLLRMRDAFGLSDNDALWVVGMLLESYDATFRQYPDKCAEAARQAMHDWLTSVAGGAAKLTPRPLGDGDLGPAQNSGRQQLAESQRELQWVTLGGFAATCVLLFGAVCLALGARLTGGHPCWVPRTAQESIAANLLLAPFGWLALLALAVPGAYAGAWGWGRGRDPGKPARERWTGWAALTAVTLGFAGWVAVLSTLAG